MTRAPLPPTPPEVRRVLQALRAHRTPGWQLPGYYLGISFDRVRQDQARLSMPVGKYCRDAQGKVALVAIAVLADIALATALRTRAGVGTRLATVSARLSFGQAAVCERLVAVARRRVAVDSLAMPLSVSALTISAGDQVLCTGEATFAVLGNRRGTAPHPLPQGYRIEELAPLEVQDLSATEQEVLERACQAGADPTSSHPFIDRFWGSVPQSGDGWAECRIDRGPHICNRIGDVQGGVLLGIAVQTACAVLPKQWRLVDITAQFLAASSGGRLIAHAESVRTGRNVAYIQCRVSDDAGVTTLLSQATLALDR